MSAQHLVWLRNDLRLDDNPALAQACQQGDIRVLYIATPGQWHMHQESPAKLGLRAAAVNLVFRQLAERGIQADYLEVDSFADCAKALKDFAQTQKIRQVWWNAEHPLDEQQRDQACSAALTAAGIGFNPCDYDLFVSQPVLTGQGEPFKVFTPYSKRWRRMLDAQDNTPFPEPPSQGKAIEPLRIQPDWAGEYRSDLWPADPEQIFNRLHTFCDEKLIAYNDKRDFPAIAATSTLSPYLALGMLGPRRLLDTIQATCAAQGRDWQSDTWLTELAWRDFYRQLLVHFPVLNKEKPFKPETDKVRWNSNEAGFKAWCEGRTGFPIVDAGMRQLNQTGWMHNRLRMITASFLTKLLLIDWREGEAYFMRTLIDGEFAANNGGWQWSASTGCDAAPYFRVFNPTRQSERFDPHGHFIRRFVPELASLSDKQLHDPSPEQRKVLGYPQPVVDYKPARQAAIDAFKNLKND